MVSKFVPVIQTDFKFGKKNAQKKRHKTQLKKIEMNSKVNFGFNNPFFFYLQIESEYVTAYLNHGYQG